MKLNRTAEQWATIPQGSILDEPLQDIAELHAEIARLTGGWQPMNTAPKDGREILARQAIGGVAYHNIIYCQPDHDEIEWRAVANDAEHLVSLDDYDEWHEIPT
jgi:hypothetical protein